MSAPHQIQTIQCHTYFSTTWLLISGSNLSLNSLAACCSLPFLYAALSVSFAVNRKQVGVIVSHEIIMIELYWKPGSSFIGIFSIYFHFQFPFPLSVFFCFPFSAFPYAHTRPISISVSVSISTFIPLIPGARQRCVYVI